MINVIDVSDYNGVIDWQAVKASGISAAIIKVGYRGYGSGTLVRESKLDVNLTGAIIAGIRVGAYFVTQAVTAAEGVEEANYCIQHLSGYKLDLPIYWDTEPSASPSGTGRGDKITRAQRTECAAAFCRTIRDAGLRPGIYCGPYWYRDQVDGAALAPLASMWIASYGKQPSIHYDGWQYTDNGSVPGISTPVDMSHFDDSIIRAAGKHYTDTTGHWAEAAIDKVTDRGLMSGRGNGIFDPDAPVTRAELATVLARMT